MLAAVDRATLAAVAASALGVDPGSGGVEVTGFTAEEIVLGDGSGLGVHRVAGAARHAGQDRQWSAVLKILDPAGSTDERSWNYWCREGFAYRSGVLASLSGGLAAPRLLHAGGGRDGQDWLWLEEVADDGERWSLGRYQLAARHLGQLSGAYLTERALPTEPWLSHNWLRSWVAEADAALAVLRTVLDHPLVAIAYPPDAVGKIFRFWEEREYWLALLDRLPQTLCHQDAFRRNLCSRQTTAGQVETVVLDWAFVGIGPVGAELAPLVLASVAFGEVDPVGMEELQRVSFDGYVAGLADVGWSGDPSLTRLGYAASGMLRYAVGCVRLILPALLDSNARSRVEQVSGRSFEETVRLWGIIARSMASVGDQARALGRGP